jgi:glycyl-tRNA synthetase
MSRDTIGDVSLDEALKLGYKMEEMKALEAVECPNCHSYDLTDPRPFNLMFRTTLGAAAEEDDPSALAYLRPETAQEFSLTF